MENQSALLIQSGMFFFLLAVCLSGAAVDAEDGTLLGPGKGAVTYGSCRIEVRKFEATQGRPPVIVISTASSSPLTEVPVVLSLLSAGTPSPFSRTVVARPVEKWRYAGKLSCGNGAHEVLIRPSYTPDASSPLTLALRAGPPDGPASQSRVFYTEERL